MDACYHSSQQRNDWSVCICRIATLSLCTSIPCNATHEQHTQVEAYSPHLCQCSRTRPPRIISDTRPTQYLGLSVVMLPAFAFAFLMYRNAPSFSTSCGPCSFVSAPNIQLSTNARQSSCACMLSVRTGNIHVTVKRQIHQHSYYNRKTYTHNHSSAQTCR